MIQLDKNATQEILMNVMREYEDKYEEYLTKRIAINNNRTKEGLLAAISAGVDKFEADDREGVTDIEDFEAKLRNQVERSTYFYINEPLIWRLVRKFDNLPIDEMDRFEAAAQGFVVAQNIFDPTRGFQFSTLAWRLMANEIIGLDKKRKRQTVVKQPDYAVICRDDCEVIFSERSRDARIIRVKGEVVDLYDIVVKERDGHEHRYRYLYFPKTESLNAGYKFKRGDIVGYTAGIETEIGSMDVYINNDEHGDVVFHNPMAKNDEAYDGPDALLMREAILDKFRNVITSLPALEQYIVRERLLPRKPRARAVIAKELGLTDSRLSKLEKNVRHHLLNQMQEAGIDVHDLSVFG